MSGDVDRSLGNFVQFYFYKRLILCALTLSLSLALFLVSLSITSSFNVGTAIIPRTMPTNQHTAASAHSPKNDPNATQAPTENRLRNRIGPTMTISVAPIAHQKRRLLSASARRAGKSSSWLWSFSISSCARQEDRIKGGGFGRGKRLRGEGSPFYHCTQ